MKIYLANNWIEYASWIQGGEIVKRVEDADLVMFEGGVDVNPEMYGEPIGKHTQTPHRERDYIEKKLFEEAVKLGKKVVGVCRGSQLTCVLNGGRLVQHQDNPRFIHDIITSTGLRIPITSTHHQAQFPYNLRDDEYEVLAWTQGMLPFHLDGENKEMNGGRYKEAEIVYYPKTKALGIQGHPSL